MNRVAQARLRDLMESHGFDRFYIYRPENFAWLTGGGDNTVEVGEGIAWLQIDGGSMRVHTSRIEVLRLAEEEVHGLEIQSHPWWVTPSPQRPNDLEHDLTRLRLVLSPEEQERFRALGSDAAAALGGVMRSAEPAWTEQKLAGATAEAMIGEGIKLQVLLAAGEERIFKYRHPLPKDRSLGRLCMTVVCGRRSGLVINLTRLCSWNYPNAGRCHEKVLRVEAAALDASRPGISLDDVLKAIKDAYVEIGRADAFNQHHQGGIAGYRPREIVAVPNEKTRLEMGMAVTWNPSLAGAKVEDTFLLTAQGPENLTVDPNWPMITVNGRKRPALLTA